MDLTYFKIMEFNCPCCGKNEMEKDFLERLDHAREMSRTPYKINSGFRCKKRNTEVGGKTGIDENGKFDKTKISSHTKGLAADIHCTNSRQRAVIIGGLVEAGFHRFGIAKTFIHVDNDQDKDYGVIWVY